MNSGMKSRDAFYEYLHSNTVYWMANDGALLVTGRVVRIDPDSISGGVHLYVYEGNKQVGYWLGSAAIVMFFSKGGEKHVDDRDRYTISIKGDAVTLTKQVGSLKPQKVVLTQAEWLKVVEIAKLAKAYSDDIRAEVAKRSS